MLLEAFRIVEQWLLTTLQIWRLSSILGAGRVPQLVC